MVAAAAGRLERGGRRLSRPPGSAPQLRRCGLPSVCIPRALLGPGSMREDMGRREVGAERSWRCDPNQRATCVCVCVYVCVCVCECACV